MEAKELKACPNCAGINIFHDSTPTGLRYLVCQGCGEIRRRFIKSGNDHHTQGWNDCLEAVVRDLRQIRTAPTPAGMRQALEALKRSLIIPAAEYVPAIPEAWAQIDAILAILAALSPSPDTVVVGRGDTAP